MVEQQSVSMNKLFIFDFDDTLVHTNSHVKVKNQNSHQEFMLTPAQYNVYIPKTGDQFDFSEFNQLIEPKIIQKTFKKFINLHKMYGGQNLYILTARDQAGPVYDLLNQFGIDDVDVIAVGAKNPEAKQSWVREQIETNDINYIEFYDDNEFNVNSIASLTKEFPHVKIIAKQIKQ